MRDETQLYTEPEPDHLDSGPLRMALIARFVRWLDAVLAREEPLDEAGLALLAEMRGSGQDPGDEGRVPRGPDLYTLYSAMTVLGQEVRLQGRTFQRVVAELEPLSIRQKEVLDENRRLVRSVEDALGALRDTSGAQVQQETKRFLEILVGVRERLQRGIAATRNQGGALEAARYPGFFARLFGWRRDARTNTFDVISALRGGNILSLAEIDDTLARENVRPVDPATGFDPRFMKAVDVQTVPGVREGTILEVYRPGYTWNGQPFRLAEVKVAAKLSEGGS